MAATQQTQLLPGVFAFFDLAPLKRCLLHELPLSCMDSELLLQHPKLTMNRKLTFPWVFCSFFVELYRRLSSNQSSRISWNPLKHYFRNMNIFYLNNGWVRCWICIFYLKNWCNFFYLWVLQYNDFLSHTIHGTGICTYNDWLILYGFHVGKYTSHMDAMGMGLIQG